MRLRLLGLRLLRLSLLLLQPSVIVAWHPCFKPLLVTDLQFGNHWRHARWSRVLLPRDLVLLLLLLLLRLLLLLWLLLLLLWRWC